MPDETWEEAARRYKEPALAALLIALATINVWNRFNVAPGRRRQVTSDSRAEGTWHDVHRTGSRRSDHRRTRDAADNQLLSTRPRRILVVLAGLLGLALGACGTDEASTATTAASNGGPTVAIQDMAYTPETLTVQAGATVTWVWRDGAVAHDVKGDDFRSKVISEGTFSHRFDQPGTHDYICTLHPNMTGTIEVTG